MKKVGQENIFFVPPLVVEGPSFVETPLAMGVIVEEPIAKASSTPYAIVAPVKPPFVSPPLVQLGEEEEEMSIAEVKRKYVMLAKVKKDPIDGPRQNRVKEMAARHSKR